MNSSRASKGGMCLKMKYVCDCVVDCSDASDENCDPSLLGQYTCSDGRGCYTESRKCDCFYDCEDRSDEEGCGKSCYKCPNSRLIYGESRACDCVLDCPDGSDEFGCDGEDENNESMDGKRKIFMCSPSECISIGKRCDGKKDCENGEDEEDCGRECC